MGSLALWPSGPVVGRGCSAMLCRMRIAIRARARGNRIAAAAGFGLVLMVVEAFTSQTALQWVTGVLAIGVGSLVGARLAPRSRVEHPR